MSGKNRECRVSGCHMRAEYICDFGWRFCKLHKEAGHFHPGERGMVPATFNRYLHHEP